MKELKEIGVEALVCDSIEKFKELL